MVAAQDGLLLIKDTQKLISPVIFHSRKMQSLASPLLLITTDLMDCIL